VLRRRNSVVMTSATVYSSVRVGTMDATVPVVTSQRHAVPAYR
jgi:hypothetical protein